LGDAADRLTAKTAIGVYHWRPRDCAGQLRLPGCKVDLGLPDMTPAEAKERGVATLLIGLAPAGGALPENWMATVREALVAGLDVASGLHVRLRENAILRTTAEHHRRTLVDVRHPDRSFSVGSYRKRSGMRLLTVGTDCCVGKMFTALALEQELRRRGHAADFRATGQTGIFIAGAGVAVDAVVADFISGAAESLSPDNHPDHWDLVEGQGSLVHPSYAGVSLGLLHGTQPDALVLCHEAGRMANGDFADLPLPTLTECAALNLQLGRLTNPGIKLIGCSLNTSRLDGAGARDATRAAAAELGVPCVDPVRDGVAALVDRLSPG
jgi:uncharacterized NAD-dependent epimerase/dehydratase family protein